jgi:hypothetical protein
LQLPAQAIGGCSGIGSVLCSGAKAPRKVRILRAELPLRTAQHGDAPLQNHLHRCRMFHGDVWPRDTNAIPRVLGGRSFCQVSHNVKATLTLLSFCC